MLHFRESAVRSVLSLHQVDYSLFKRCEKIRLFCSEMVNFVP